MLVHARIRQGLPLIHGYNPFVPAFPATKSLHQLICTYSNTPQVYDQAIPTDQVVQIYESLHVQFGIRE